MLNRLDRHGPAHPAVCASRHPDLGDIALQPRGEVREVALPVGREVEVLWALAALGQRVEREIIAGRAVEVRFDWLVESATTARWEQAFSFDDG